MSDADAPASEFAAARQAVDAATDALLVASRKRVPSRELAEARKKLKLAEERLDRVRAILHKEADSVSLTPKGAKEPPRPEARD